MSGYIFLWSLLAQVGLILLKKRWILTENLVRVHFKILGTSLFFMKLQSTRALTYSYPLQLTCPKTMSCYKQNYQKMCWVFFFWWFIWLKNILFNRSILKYTDTDTYHLHVFLIQSPEQTRTWHIIIVKREKHASE